MHRTTFFCAVHRIIATIHRFRLLNSGMRPYVCSIQMIQKMEILNNNRNNNHMRARVFGGIIAITFGIIYIFELQGFNVHPKVISWETLLISIGAYSLVKHNFQKLAGYILIGIGGIFLLDDLTSIHINTKIILPIIAISIGVSMILKGLKISSKKKWAKNLDSTTILEDNSEISSEEIVDTTAFFGGVSKNIISKNFKGGSASSYFGGTELNMTKAELNGTAVLDITSIFAGTTLIVPSGWQIRSEMTTIFGGIDDKRPVMDTSTETNKILLLRGSCIFGGVDIQSYV